MEFILRGHKIGSEETVQPFFILVYTINSFFRKLLFTPPGDIHQNAKFEYKLSIINTMFYDV